MRFCKQLYRAFYETEMTRQRRDLRHKNFVDPDSSDRELFESLDLGDLWIDAKLADTYLYVRENRHVEIPESWRMTIANFDMELFIAVPHWHSQLDRLYKALHLHACLPSKYSACINQGEYGRKSPC